MPCGGGAAHLCSFAPALSTKTLCQNGGWRQASAAWPVNFTARNGAPKLATQHRTAAPAVYSRHSHHLAIQPTYVIALIFAFFVVVSLLFELLLFMIEGWCKRAGRQGLLAALRKLTLELTLLGFVSLLVGAGPVGGCWACLGARPAGGCWAWAEGQDSWSCNTLCSHHRAPLRNFWGTQDQRMLLLSAAACCACRLLLPERSRLRPCLTASLACNPPSLPLAPAHDLPVQSDQLVRQLQQLHLGLDLSPESGRQVQRLGARDGGDGGVTRRGSLPAARTAPHRTAPPAPPAQAAPAAWPAPRESPPAARLRSAAPLPSKPMQESFGGGGAQGLHSGQPSRHEQATHIPDPTLIHRLCAGPLLQLPARRDGCGCFGQLL